MKKNTDNRMKKENLPETPAKFYEKARNLINNYNSSVINPEPTLITLYNIVDEYMEFIKHSGNNKCACGPGCSYCCYQDIPCTHYEAELISKTSGRLKEAGNPNKLYNNDKCPFLNNKKCSIYDGRPFVCRTYISFSDPNMCKKNNPKRKLFGQRIPDTSRPDWNNFHSDFLNGLYIILTKHINEQYPYVKDIRSFFP